MVKAKIDSNIPLPSKWPFPNMKVGDSFAVPDDVKRQTIAVAAMRYGKKNNMKFTVRKGLDKHLRCWRIA